LILAYDLAKEEKTYMISFMKWFEHKKYCKIAMILINLLFRLPPPGGNKLQPESSQSNLENDYFDSGVLGGTSRG